MPWTLSIEGAGEVPLEEGEVTLGRGAECDVLLTGDDLQVSRRHAVLRVAGNVLTVEDAGSRNGTLVNEKPAAGAVALGVRWVRQMRAKVTADGRPPFSRELHPALDPRKWDEQLTDTFERFLSELDLIESELPEGMDPDSEDADPYYAHLPFDPYAAHDEAEFFAVTSEAFFVAPDALQRAFNGGVDGAFDRAFDGAFEGAAVGLALRDDDGGRPDDN